MRRDYGKYRDLSERITNVIDENTLIDKESGTINGVCIFRRESKNNRIYSEKAEQSIIQFLEGAKCFQDHGGVFTGQSVGSLIGEFHRPTKFNGGVYADLSVLKNAKDRELLFEIVEERPFLSGFSIHARGVFNEKKDDKGREQIDDVIELYSADWVGSPACTSGMYENENGQNEQTNESNSKDGGDLYMDKTIAYIDGKIKTKGLTEDGVDSAVLEYIKKLEDAQESLTGSVATLTEEKNQAEEEALANKKELEKVQEGLKDASAKLTSYQDKEAAEKAVKERKEMIGKVLENEKFPKEKVSKAFMRILMEIRETEGDSVEDRIKDLIKDRQGTMKAEDGMDISAGHEQKNESEGNDNRDHATKVKEAREKLKEAVGYRSW